jgi:hypothetical protein
MEEIRQGHIFAAGNLDLAFADGREPGWRRFVGWRPDGFDSNGALGSFKLKLSSRFDTRPPACAAR